MTKKFKNFAKIFAVILTCFALLVPFSACELDGDELHLYSEWEVVEPNDCGHDGLKERICYLCDDVQSEVIPATGNHTYGGWETSQESDCVHTGLKERTCSVCGDIDTQDIPALSASGTHSYGEWKTVKENYCGNDGEKERTCSVCNDVEKEVIPAVAEHNYGEWKTVKQNDCGTDGEKQRSCSNCDYVETEVIPATGDHNFEDGICTVCGQSDGLGDELLSGDEQGAKSSDLSIHFLELGTGATGDSILIKCGNTEVLIDAGAVQGSATTIKSYINKYCTDGKLEYVISTHADTDHIAAFVGNSSGGKYDGILYSYEIGTLIKFDITGKSTDIYNKYCDAVSYAESRGTQVFTASQCYDQTVEGAQRQYYLDSEQKVSINILYNYYYYNKSSDENNHSVVTLLTEELEGGNRRNYLFTGDLEKDGESRMVDYYKNVPADRKTDYNVLPKVDLYKAGHHGSKTSSTAKLLAVINPKYVAVCCCCGSPQYTTTNDNTFPTQIMIDNVGKYTDKIYVTTLCTSVNEKDSNGNFTSKNYGDYTSMNGNIVFYSKNGRLNLWCSNNDTILKDTEWFKENRVWNGI